MAILVATSFNWKPDVTEEKRNNLMKRGLELDEKYGLNRSSSMLLLQQAVNMDMSI